MPSLRWKDLFRALFLAGFLGYLSVAVSGIIWVGIPVLILAVWLLYDFRKKTVVLKETFLEQTPKAVKVFFTVIKDSLWREQLAKVYSYIALPFILLLWMLIATLIGKKEPIIALVMIQSLVCWLALVLTVSRYEVTDEQIGKVIIKLPKIFFWQIPKFLLKVTIVTIYRVHSRELVAVSMYSLSGMLYIIVFPPFQLAPAMIFLLAAGCGIFTGLCGLAMHWILSTALAQSLFVLAETW